MAQYDAFLTVRLFPPFFFREIVKVTGSRAGVVRVNELIPR